MHRGSTKKVGCPGPPDSGPSDVLGVEALGSVVSFGSSLCRISGGRPVEQKGCVEAREDRDDSVGLPR